LTLHPCLEYGIDVTSKVTIYVKEKKDMNDVIQNIVTRRSVRKFQSRQLDEEVLKEILFAASYAPNAGGRQSPLMVVCQNEAINDELGRLNRSISQEINAQRPPAAQANATINASRDMDPASAFYGAPTVITLFAPKDWYNFTMDCAAAAQTIQLAAHSLGVGSCIIARALDLFQTETGKKYMQEWKVGEDYEAKIHVLLGYPDGEPPEAKPRKEDQVIRIS
jgi:nitroreductase